jgi:hypothetical protein
MTYNDNQPRYRVLVDKTWSDDIGSFSDGSSGWDDQFSFEIHLPPRTIEVEDDNDNENREVRNHALWMGLWVDGRPSTATAEGDNYLHMLGIHRRVVIRDEE